MVIAQVVFDGVVDVVVVIRENNIVQLLDDARYFEACGITFEDPFVVGCEHAVGVMNAQSDIDCCASVRRSGSAPVLGSHRWWQYLVLHHRQAPRR